MYFPYLRGKQNEMLALIHLSPLLLQRASSISPIIEPAVINAGFRRQLKLLLDKNINFTIIINPKVGDYKNNHNVVRDLIETVFSGYSNYQLGILTSPGQDLRFLPAWINGNLTPRGFTIIHEYVDPNFIQLNNFVSQSGPIIYNVINSDKTKSDRNYSSLFTDDSVIMADYFNYQTKNVLYVDIPQSNFGNDFSTYLTNGYVGFGDYLTIGDRFAEGGSSPYAVALHLSYEENNTILVKHFVSTTNEDQTDPGGKFKQANDSLVEWCDLNQVNTQGANLFRQLAQQNHYPGLGVAKKNSIIHHIELVLSLI